MSFKIPVYTNWPIVIPNATSTSDGVMSAEDKAKLDSLTPGGSATLAQTYLNGANPADSTMIVDSTRGPVVVDGSLVLDAPAMRAVVDDSTNAGTVGVEIANDDVATVTGLNSPYLKFSSNTFDEVENVTAAVLMRSEAIAASSASVQFAIRAVLVGGVSDADVQLFRLDSDAVGTAVIGNVGLQLSGAALNDVLTFDGSKFVPAPGGGGGIGGTIAVNQVAFGTAFNTIGGDARITWTAGTGIFSVNNGLGPFLDVNTVTSVLTVSDPVTPSVSTLTPNEISVTDNVAAQISLKVQSGTPTIDTTVIGVGALDLAVNELQVNGAPGAAGQVLTSNGPGVAPTWQAGGGGGGVASVTASAPLASSGGLNPNISLNVSGVTAATYTYATVAVDVYGRVTSASSGTAPALMTIGEIPGGPVNGLNTVFTTAANYQANTTAVYVNGVRQLRGVGNDYTESGANQITFTVAPLAGFKLQLDYYPV